MTATITELKPSSLWNVFHLFTQHPRPSRHEEAVLCAIEALCDEHGLHHVRDDIGNLIIRKPATAGMENRKGVVMQGHIDMVPQKNADSVHDFLTDPISTYIEDGWVSAHGTTLGADNGIGVAAALAVLISNDIEHGPLELLITIDEESGMTGAYGLKSGWLESEILLNLDTEDEGELYVGCAGGVDISAEFKMQWQMPPQNSIAFELAVRGLRGGHSGLDIDAGRGNANKIANRFLLEHMEPLGLSVFNFNGGTLRNAIPREAFTGIVIPNDQIDAMHQAIDEFKANMLAEFGSVESNLSIELIEQPLPSRVYDTTSSLAVIRSVAACVHGVTRMSPSFEGVVETSNNLAIVKSEADSVQVLCLTRSLSDSARDDLARSVAATFDLAGAAVTIAGEYPGWKPDPDSHILTVMSAVYESMYQVTPKVKVIHAGLECGLLGKPYPHWDMISMGPTIRHAHSPDEKVHIESVAKFWDYLLECLKHIPEKS